MNVQTIRLATVGTVLCVRSHVWTVCKLYNVGAIKAGKSVFQDSWVEFSSWRYPRSCWDPDLALSSCSNTATGNRHNLPRINNLFVSTLILSTFLPQGNLYLSPLFCTTINKQAWAFSLLEVRPLWSAKQVMTLLWKYIILAFCFYFTAVHPSDGYPLPHPRRMWATCGNVLWAMGTGQSKFWEIS